jgi:hypothetical protein
MTQTFEDRVEEVLGLLHGMAWPILEERDKKRVVAKVARGIDKGDTAAAWARALGCDRTTIARRVEHFRRQEPIDGVQIQKRSAAQVTGDLRRYARENPEAVAAAMSDRQTRRVVENALYAQPEVDGSRDVIHNTIDSTHQADRILGPLGHIHSVLWREARKIASVQQPRKAERDELLLAADELRMYADTFESFGRESLDSTDFAEWLEERQER